MTLVKGIVGRDVADVHVEQAVFVHIRDVDAHALEAIAPEDLRVWSGNGFCSRERHKAELAWT